MSDWSKALAPVVAKIVYVVLGLLIAYAFWMFAPLEFREWVFDLLDKYLPSVAEFIQ